MQSMNTRGRAGCVAVSVLAGLLGACVGPRAHETSVGEVVDAWHLAAARGESEAYFGAMTPDAVFIGTDASERWDRAAFRAYAAPYFDRPLDTGETGETTASGGAGAFRPAWVYTPTERHVTLDERARVAWFDELLDSQSYGTARGTGVAVRSHDGRWRIAHYALTFPIPNELARGMTEQIRAFEASATPAATPEAME
ncbi:MAG: nuclear transport factor 2 family protein [Planctomycetota bacterium]